MADVAVEHNFAAEAAEHSFAADGEHNFAVVMAVDSDVLMVQLMTIQLN